MTADRQATIVYTESHSAVRWPHLLNAALWVLLLAVGIAAIAWSRNPGLSFLPGLGVLGTAIAVAMIVVVWPTGIQVRSDGLLIGGIHRAQRPGRGLPSADGRWRRPFFCPWSAIRSAEVITDHAYIRRTSKDYREPGKVALGIFWAPFTRSALLLEVDTEAVAVPGFREPDTRRPFFRPANFTVPFTSPLWLVPTRHPEALRAALAQSSASQRS